MNNMFVCFDWFVSFREASSINLHNSLNVCGFVVKECVLHDKFGLNECIVHICIMHYELELH